MPSPESASTLPQHLPKETRKHRLLHTSPAFSPFTTGQLKHLTLTQLYMTLRHLKLLKLSCLIIYFHPLVITPCIYSSLEFTKLFNIITFNLSLKHPYEVSKTFILVLQRKKKGSERATLLKAMCPKVAKLVISPDFPKHKTLYCVHSHFQRL